jgi:hypothetical protein
MVMIHVARRVLGAVVVLVIVAGATLALSSRPRLNSDRDDIEQQWHAVKGALAKRYALVDKLALAVDGAGGPANPLVDLTRTTVKRWTALGTDTSVATAIATSNTLEGLARRLQTTIAASPILHADPVVTATLRNVTSQPLPSGVASLNAAVARYEKDRGGPVRRLAAGPLGFDAIPRFSPALRP